MEGISKYFLDKIKYYTLVLSPERLESMLAVGVVWK